MRVRWEEEEEEEEEEENGTKGGGEQNIAECIFVRHEPLISLLQSCCTHTHS